MVGAGAVVLAVVVLLDNLLGLFLLAFLRLLLFLGLLLFLLVYLLRLASNFVAVSLKSTLMFLHSTNLTVIPELSETKTFLFGARLHDKSAEGIGDDHLLDTGVAWRASIIDMKTLESFSTAGGLVRNHATDGLVDHHRWSAEVSVTTSRVCTHSFMKISKELDWKEKKEMFKGRFTTVSKIFSKQIQTLVMNI